MAPHGRMAAHNSNMRNNNRIFFRYIKCLFFVRLITTVSTCFMLFLLDLLELDKTILFFYLYCLDDNNHINNFYVFLLKLNKTVFWVGFFLVFG